MSDYKKDNKVKFWLEDPCALLKSLSIFPNMKMSKAEKLNALTRLVVVITGVMYVMEYEYWSTFLVLALFVIIVLQYSGNDNKKKEKFTVTPTYVGTDFQQTTVSPIFAEEWQIPPPAYDLYTNVPNGQDTFETPLQPQSYPYGQYLTKTNLLPSDEYYTHLGCGSPRTAREYVNSTFLRHDLARRENQMRLYKKSLNRRFRHNCNDTFSPYMSY